MISDSKLQEAIKWYPHTGQKEVLEALKDPKVRDITICAGRRYGKSAICAYIALKEILQPNRHVWIVSPTYDLSEKVFTYLVKWFSKVAPSQAPNIQSRPNPKIRCANGSWVECKSAENPASLLGEELDLVIVDEAARVSQRVYDAYVFPTTASRKGKSIFISTPFGQNWFYTKFAWCKENTEIARAFQYRSIDNPTFPHEEWDRAKGILPSQVFQQEYEASFLPDAASVFRGVDEIIKDNCLRDSEVGHTYVMGVDLGKHEDFTVLTVIDRYTNNVVYFDRFNQIDYPFQRKRIEATAKRYNNARLIVDSTAVGEPIREDLERMGLLVDDFRFTNQSKKELVEKLSIFIEQGQLTIPPNEDLINELHVFGYQLTDFRNIIYRAPQGLHDDCVMSLGLAVWGLTGSAHPKTAIQEELDRRARSRIKSNFV